MSTPSSTAIRSNYNVPIPLSGKITSLIPLILLDPLPYPSRSPGLLRGLAFIPSSNSNLRLYHQTTQSGARELEKDTDPIYLWQLFFANPYEWWDNRKKKLNPRAPDFKHKDTGECLWLNPKNPPWVRRQLQLLDSKMTELGYPEPESSRSRMSVCKFENYEID